MTFCGLFFNSSRPTCIDVTRRPAARMESANCCGVRSYSPAVSTWVTPIERARRNIAPGSFDIERRLQSCSPTGAPTDPIVRTLPVDAAGADAVAAGVREGLLTGGGGGHGRAGADAVAAGVREALLTGADVAQASAGASAAAAARKRTVNCVIGDSELGFV